jgi:pyruvate,water dikinase
LDRGLAILRQILPLNEATDASACGGKAVQLGAALRAGLPVPPGLVITASMTARIATGDRKPISALKDAYQASFDGPIAVRSSATDEDSADASFAGQHQTLLNVRTFEMTHDAVIAVWQSAQSEAALAYRRQLGVTGDPACAVVLQTLVEPDCAGVLFTIDPMSGEDLRVVEAAWGFGEAVVSGLVTPDHVRMDRTGTVVSSQTGAKEYALRLAAAGGLEEREIETALVGQLCLDAVQLQRLNDLAATAETVYGPTFGAGLDIEWAFGGDTLYLLQARPITTGPA